MSLFTVHRYLGESQSVSDTPPGNQQQSILDKLNARAKARQEQRSKTPQGNTAPLKRSKVSDTAHDTPSKDASVSPTLSRDSTRKKKKKKIARQQDSSIANLQEEDEPPSSIRKTDSAKRTKDKSKFQVGSTHSLKPDDNESLQCQDMQKEDKNIRKDEVPMATGRGTMLTAKERKQRVIDLGLVPKDSVIVKKKKGRRKSDGGKVINNGDDTIVDAKIERTEKERLNIKDGELNKHSPMSIKKKNGKRKIDGGNEKSDETNYTIDKMTKNVRLEAKIGESIQQSPSITNKKKRKSDVGKGDSDKTGPIQSKTSKEAKLDEGASERSPSLAKRTNERVKSSRMKDKKEQKMVDSRQASEDESKRTNDDSDGEEDEGLEVEGRNEGDEEEKVEEETSHFVVLGDFERKHKKKVHETLPDWLAKPSVIQRSLTDDLLPVTSIQGLDERLIAALTTMGVTKFFPVQQHVIPILLQSLRYGIHTGNAGFRPRDLCISAPTGSGKTLAYAIPIVQALMNRVVCRVRALVVLPTRDLATQVHRIISALCNATPLKAVLIGGTKKFAQEQSLLVRESDGEFHSLADIVVATPGRLVDNLTQTNGFSLQHLRFLVIDEADRLMEHISQDWITQVEKSAYTPQSDNGTFLPSFSSCRQQPGPLTVNRSSRFQLPLQKLLFSATLSQNPEKLTQLRLFQPRLITTATGNRALPAAGFDLDREKEGEIEDEGEEKEGRSEFVGKYTTPHGLSEYYVQCTAGEKPLVLQHFLCNLYFKQVLCFTNSIQTTHRLYLLLKLMGGVDVAEFSSNLSQSERQNILKQFKAGKIQILICSDAMARGMDIENVRCVISYDLPPHLKTYIHRVGRTARAGRSGTAFSFVRKKEIKEFKHMLRNAGKEGIQRHTVSTNQLEALTPAYTETLSRLSSMMREEKGYQR